MNRRFRPGSTSDARFWVAVGTILLASTVFHAAVWPEAPVTQPDSRGYLEAADDLRDLRLETLHDRTLGYPVFLMLAGASERPQLVFVQQLLIHSLSTLFLALLGTALGMRRGLVLVLVVLASIPPSVAPAGYILSESLSECTLILTVGSLLLWLRGSGKGWLMFAGVAAASAALVRPTYQLLGATLACILMLAARFLPGWRRRLRSGALVLFLVPALLLGGFVFFNHHNFGFAGLTPLFGFNLTTRTIRVAERLPDEYGPIRNVLVTYRDRDLTAPGSDHSGSMSVWAAIPELCIATGLDRLELSQRMMGVNLRLIRDAPLHYLAEVGRSMATYWMPASTELANFGSRRLQLAWIFLSMLILFLFLLNVLAFSGLLMLAGIAPPGQKPVLESKQLALTIALSICFTVIFYSMWVSALVEIGNPRYRAPTDLLILFSSLLGIELWMRVRGRSTTPPLAAMAEGTVPAPSSLESYAR